jgi:hypothetical protein
MVALSEVGLVIFGFGAANVLVTAARRATTTSAIPSVKFRLQETCRKLEEPEIMALA